MYLFCVKHHRWSRGAELESAAPVSDPDGIHAYGDRSAASSPTTRAAASDAELSLQVLIVTPWRVVVIRVYRDLARESVIYYAEGGEEMGPFQTVYVHGRLQEEMGHVS
jgi:hypothetical protein